MISINDTHVITLILQQYLLTYNESNKFSFSFNFCSIDVFSFISIFLIPYRYSISISAKSL